MIWPFVFGGIASILILGAVPFARWAWDNDHDLLGPLLTALAVLLALILGSVAIGTVVDRASCQRYGRSIGYTVEWELVGGCYVNVAGRTVPRDWIMPVVEGERLRIEISEPQG